MLAADNARIVSVPNPGSTPNAPNAGTDSKDTGFITSGVLVGKQDPANIIPCFGCVSGVDIETLLIAVPLSAIQAGAPLTITVIGDNIFYAGNAAFTYAFLDPTGAVVMSGTVAGPVYPSIWMANFNVNAPPAGVYTLEGDIATGENYKNHSSVTAQFNVSQSGT